MRVLSKKGLKKKFKDRRMRIGNDSLDYFIKILEENLNKNIERIVRNAKLSGRKAIKKEDFN